MSGEKGYRERKERMSIWIQRDGRGDWEEVGIGDKLDVEEDDTIEVISVEKEVKYIQG